MYPLNDEEIALLVCQIRNILYECPTLDKITCCYNVMAGVLNVCCIQADKESVIHVVDEFHKGLINHVESIYEGRNELD